MFPNSKVSAHGYAGKTIDVAGKHLRIEQLVAEGGFSFVFTARDLSSGKQYALKKVLCQNRETLDFAKAECERMAMLPKHPNLIEFFGYTISQAPPPQQSAQEVWMLMEYASGSHLVNLMNDRRSRRFTDSEILRIFYDICLAVAMLHTHEPPIAHRDLKVENILLNQPSSSGADADLLYKLCDFGSCTTKPYVLLTKEEITDAEQDVQRNTTMAYRAPEQCDLYSRNPITEKVDVWALGCVLYKLCYYRTPFEENGQPSILKIVNCKYDFDAMPPYSQRIKDLISKMLIADPMERPDTFWVLEEVCKMRQVAYPLKIRTGKYKTQLMCHNLKTYSEVVEEERAHKKGSKNKGSKKKAENKSASVIDPDVAAHLLGSASDGPVLDPVEFEADFSSMSLGPGQSPKSISHSSSATSFFDQPSSAAAAPASVKPKQAPSAKPVTAAPGVNNSALFSKLDWFAGDSGSSPVASSSGTNMRSSMKLSNDDLLGLDQAGSSNSGHSAGFQSFGEDSGFSPDPASNDFFGSPKPFAAPAIAVSNGTANNSDGNFFAAFEDVPQKSNNTQPSSNRSSGSGVSGPSSAAKPSLAPHKRIKSTSDISTSSVMSSSSKNSEDASMLSLLDMPLESPTAAGADMDSFFGPTPSSTLVSSSSKHQKSALEGKSSKLSYLIKDLPIYAVSAKQKAYVIKATSRIREGPKHKYVRRILWDLHSHKDSHLLNDLCNNYTAYILMDRPILKDPVVAIKCLLLIHHLVLEGPRAFSDSLVAQKSRINECLVAIEDRYRPSSREIAGFLDIRRQIDSIMRGKFSDDDRGELLVFMYASFLRVKVVNQEKDQTLFTYLQVLWRLCYDAYAKYLAIPLLVGELFGIFQRNTSWLDMRKAVIDYWGQVDKNAFWHTRVALPSLESALTSSISGGSFTSFSSENLEKEDDDSDDEAKNDEATVEDDDDAAADVSAKDIEDVVKASPLNNVCCDCGAKNPRWASINIGCFLCHQCAGLHRSLGTHISKVRSVTLDLWDGDTVKFMATQGNEKVNRKYEANFRAKRPNPNVDVQEMLRFVRDKYVSKKFYSDTPVGPALSTEGVSTPLRTPQRSASDDRRTPSVGDDVEFLRNLEALGSAKKK